VRSRQACHFVSVEEPLEPRDAHHPPSSDVDGWRELARPAQPIKRVSMQSDPLCSLGDAQQIR
jgi:hypothetical protein